MSREPSSERGVRICGVGLLVLFQTFIATEQYTAWASPPDVALRAEEVVRVRPAGTCGESSVLGRSSGLR